MQALVKGLQNGTGPVARLLPALGAASARITTTSAACAESVDNAGQTRVSDQLQREFQIYRWHPEEGGKPRYQSYNVDLNR